MFFVGLLSSTKFVFCWLAVFDKVFTTDVLRWRGLALVAVLDSCVLCRKDRESIYHLLVHCEFVHFLWCCFLGRSEFFGALLGWRRESLMLGGWLLMVGVDSENSRVFQCISTSREDVAQLVLVHIAKWASSREEFDY